MLIKDGDQGFGSEIYKGGVGDDWLIVDAFKAKFTIDLQFDTVSGFERLVIGKVDPVGNATGTATVKLLAEQLAGIGNTIVGNNDADDAELIYVAMGNKTTFDFSTVTFTDIAISGHSRDRIYITGDSDSEKITGSVRGGVISGISGADTIVGGVRNDTLKDGTGDDTLDGGEGTDTADFSDRGFKVTASLDASGNGLATIDNGSVTKEKTTLRSIERIISGTNDDLTGNAAANTLSGGKGSDSLAGMGGGDKLDGGEGFDYAEFHWTSTKVAFNLEDGAAVGIVGSDTVTLSGIEAIVSGGGNDTLSGDARANLLDSGAGNDKLKGEQGDDTLVGGTGTDTLDGGSEIDTADYGWGTKPIVASLYLASPGKGEAVVNGETDQLVNIENIIGARAKTASAAQQGVTACRVAMATTPSRVWMAAIR